MYIRDRDLETVEGSAAPALTHLFLFFKSFVSISQLGPIGDLRCQLSSSQWYPYKYSAFLQHFLVICCLYFSVVFCSSYYLFLSLALDTMLAVLPVSSLCGCLQQLLSSALCAMEKQDGCLTWALLEPESSHQAQGLCCGCPEIPIPAVHKCKPHLRGHRATEQQAESLCEPVWTCACSLNLTVAFLSFIRIFL